MPHCWYISLFPPETAVWIDSIEILFWGVSYFFRVNNITDYWEYIYQRRSCYHLGAMKNISEMPELIEDWTRQLKKQNRPWFVITQWTQLRNCTPVCWWQTHLGILHLLPICVIRISGENFDFVVVTATGTFCGNEVNYLRQMISVTDKPGLLISQNIYVSYL